MPPDQSGAGLAPPQVAAPTNSRLTGLHDHLLSGGLRAAEPSADERRAEEASRPGPSIPTTDPVVTLALLRDAVRLLTGTACGSASPTVLGRRRGT